MTLTMIQILLITAMVGALVGFFIAYFIMRSVIKRNSVYLNRMLQTINRKSARREKEFKEKKDNLLLLTDRIKKIDSNLKMIRHKELVHHVNELNTLLDTIGIGQIK